MYRDEVQAFRDRLFIRAREKREAAVAEYEAEQRQKRIEASPDGLDPQEVFESLPEEMRTCFESQDIAKLQDVATTMDNEVDFCVHLYCNYRFSHFISTGVLNRASGFQELKVKMKKQRMNLSL